MVNFKWNMADSRAFVPTPSLISSPDVIAASLGGVIDSKSPFSVGVYVVDESSTRAAGSGADFRPLDLLYLSKAVVDDRARSSPPIPAGWYLPIGKEEDMGKSFEIRVTTRQEKLVEAYRRELPGADIAIHHIKVDGHLSMGKWGVAYDPSGDIAGICFRYCGFQESETATGLTGHFTLRSFRFSKPDVSEKESNCAVEDSHDFGMIELEVESACKGPPVTNYLPSSAAAVPNCAPVSERSVMKKGATVALKQDGKPISGSAEKTDYVVSSRKLASSLSIRIYVRERSWLMSRHIVDSDGRPCTADMSQALEDANAARVSKRPLKRIKMEPGEVIHLD